MKGAPQPQLGTGITFLIVLKAGSSGSSSKALLRGHGCDSGMEGQRKITRSPQVPKGVRRDGSRGRRS